MKLIYPLLFITLFLSSLHAQEVATLAKELKLYGGLKATIQWERIFLHLVGWKNIILTLYQIQNAVPSKNT